MTMPLGQGGTCASVSHLPWTLQLRQQRALVPLESRLGRQMVVRLGELQMVRQLSLLHQGRIAQTHSPDVA